MKSDLIKFIESVNFSCPNHLLMCVCMFACMAAWVDAYAYGMNIRMRTVTV